MPAPGPNASYAEKRQWITEPNKDFGKYISAESDTDVLEHNTAHLTVKDKSYTLEEQIHRDFLNIGSLDIHPAEENAGGSITDKIAKESSDSNASTHPMHDNAEADMAGSGGNQHAAAHKANPGPVHADNLPTPESKEDLKKRAEELNK